MNIKPFLLPIIATLLILIISGLIVKNLFFKPSDAGLKVDSTPASIVYLDGKEVGRTPYESEKLSTGEKTIKIVPEQTFGNLNSWEVKVKLVSGALAVVKKDFAEDESQSSGYIITMEPIVDKKTSSLLIVSIPDSAVVRLDGDSKGFTPVSLDKLSEGDKIITLTAPDFTDKTINAKLYKGFKTIINETLAQSIAAETGELTPTPSLIASITPTPKVTGKITPTPAAKVTPTTPATPYVIIKATETGWLRVRAEASSKTGQEIGRVLPGEKYSLLDEVTDWYKISFGTNKEGWISAAYATKVE
jgi:hypothetical protein